MILYPNAKINIGLNLLYKREDGFHELQTLMYPINLTDTITIKAAHQQKQKIKLSVSGITIDGNPNDNLIVKAYNIIDHEYNLPPLNIHLHKIIPFGAGLGGGSADCAFTIKGINDFCNLDIPIAKMEKYAAELGSDCPFFIRNKPAISTGRGEILELFNINISNYYFVIIIPPIPISTKTAYSLVKPHLPKFNLKESLQKDINLWKGSVVNNFEDSVYPQYPKIKDIKDILYSKGAKYASLSGSGSAVFGIFKDKPNIEGIFPKDYFIWNS